MEGNTWKYLLPSMSFQVLVREKIDTPTKVKLHPKIKSKTIKVKRQNEIWRREINKCKLTWRDEK